MLTYVNASNIDDRVLRKAAAILTEGGLVAWPSDTSWSISCGLGSKAGIAALKALKGLAEFVPSVVCSDLSQFDDLVNLETPQYRRLKSLVPGPFVFIFEARHAIHKQMAMKRKEIGLRIPDHPVPLGLVKAMGQPIFAITASRQMSEPGWWDDSFAAENLFEYGAELEDIPGIALVIDSGEVLPKQLSTVVSLIEGEPLIIRQGIGNF